MEISWDKWILAGFNESISIVKMNNVEFKDEQISNMIIFLLKLLITLF